MWWFASLAFFRILFVFWKIDYGILPCVCQKVEIVELLGCLCSLFIEFKVFKCYFFKYYPPLPSLGLQQCIKFIALSAQTNFEFLLHQFSFLLLFFQLQSYLLVSFYVFCLLILTFCSHIASLPFFHSFEYL